MRPRCCVSGITSKVVVRVLFGFTLDRAKPIAYRATNAQPPTARESRDSQVVERIQSYGFSFLPHFVGIIFNRRFDGSSTIPVTNNFRRSRFISDLDAADYAVPKKIQPGRSLSSREAKKRTRRKEKKNWRIVLAIVKRNP